jgi:hypothetical protein
MFSPGTGKSGYHTVSQSLLMVRLPALFAAVLLLVAAASLHAGAPIPPARGTSILGNVWTADNQPIPGARLRLRNVGSGKIEAVTAANEAGKFTFSGVEPGTYVVELVNESASVLAVSHVVPLAVDETVATFVRLGRSRGLLGVFENAAAAVVTGAALFHNASTAVTAAAASLGITGVTPASRPASAGR